MATYSSNITTKFTGTQIVVEIVGLATPVTYTVPAGKTLVGGWTCMGSGTTVAIGSVVIGALSTNPLTGVLHVNGGETITLTSSTGGQRASIYGVLMENTP